MCHIHTSFVFRHLVARGNNKMICSKKILPSLTCRTLAQLRTNKSHPSPLCPLCNTHNTNHLFNCTHIRTTLSPMDLWTDPARVTALLARWSENPAGGPQAGRSDTPTSRGSRCVAGGLDSSHNAT